MTAYILNLFDLLCTLYALKLGTSELNPLMQNIPMMIIHKVVIVGCLCWWLSHRPERIARIGLWICTVVYAALALWHSVGIYSILLGRW
jgi:hypothetical protein